MAAHPTCLVEVCLLIYLANFPTLIIVVETVYFEDPAEIDRAIQLMHAQRDVKRDSGYLMTGWRRVLRDAGDGEKWWYTQSDADNEKTVYQEYPPYPETPFVAPDIYADTRIFTNS
jgi:hypothetical protein